jgi:hypothetical protein
MSHLAHIPMAGLTLIQWGVSLSNMLAITTISLLNSEF